MPVFSFYNFKIRIASRVVYWAPRWGLINLNGWPFSNNAQKSGLVIRVGGQDKHKPECITIPFAMK